jgi:hypothetical protein
MRTTMIGIGALALSLVGCAADIGENGSTLRRVNERAMTSQVLYLAAGIAVPLTAEQMEAEGHDFASAVPVRVEIFENTAVAWYAPEGEAVLGVENIRALWQVERQEISDEIVPDGEGEGEGETTPDTTNTLRQDIPGLGTDLQIDRETLWNPVGTVIIDFVDEYGSSEEAWMLEEIGSSHPGCL